MRLIKNRSIFYDSILKKTFMLVGLTCLFVLFLIMVFLFKEGLPVLKTNNLFGFLFGTDWYPTAEPPQFGILPLVLASLGVTFVSSLISVPLSLSIAIYLSEMAPRSLREVLKPLIEIIASIPSVVVGFFGMVVIAPLLQNLLDINTGLNLFNAALMLAFMAIPTIASISEDAISSVPVSLKEASYALGANRWQTIRHVTLPASLSGVYTAIILGISRVMGETMVVLMVAGGSTLIPRSIFDPVRPLTANIAAEMAEAGVGSSHYHALFAIGIILFLITFGFNMIAGYLSRKYAFKTS